MNRGTEQSLCRLCRSRPPDIKAHIMAEGLMKLVHGQPKYDGQFMMIGNGLRKPVRRPTGSYDRNILCAECDNKLGKYDLAAIKFCKRNDFESHPSGVASLLSKVDKASLKLFALSYIWRASITQLSEYDMVNLGYKHESKIANMLRNNDAGGIDDYSVIMTRFNLPEERKMWGMHVLNPTTNRLDGINIVNVYLPNLYKWIVKVDSRPFGKTMRDMSLGAMDEALILDMGEYTNSQEFSFMHDAIMKMHGNK